MVKGERKPLPSSSIREYRLISEAISKFQLDLYGKTIFTEAASNDFVWTPIIAAVAGAAKVYALTRDSRYATAQQVVRATKRHACALGVEKRIVVVPKKEAAFLNEASIITNLGFVRPIDKWTISQITPGAVICLMWEPWEFRAEDIDLNACKDRGIAVIGTNEQEKRVSTFNYIGLMVLKILLDNKMEVLNSKILLLGSGIFAKKGAETLVRNGGIVFTSNKGLPASILSYDCIVCLEHLDKNKLLIGDGGIVNKTNAKGMCPLIVHICGRIDIDFINKKGWIIVPSKPAQPGVMSFNTATVGPKPVIDLHTAGLRVGQAYLENDRKVLRKLALPLFPRRLDSLVRPS